MFQELALLHAIYSSCRYIQKYIELAWIYTISDKKEKEDHCLKISVIDKTIGQLLFFLVAKFPPIPSIGT